MDDIYNDAKLWLEKRVGQRIGKTSSDFLILVKFLHRHPNFDNWKFQEPSGFQIIRNSQKSINLMVKFQGMKKYRVVSWVACARKKVIKINSLNSAMRYAIRRQISKFRKSTRFPICELCKSENRIEVDHYPNRFCDIRDDFIEN